MFRAIITFSYIIPGIYLFVRILQLFIPRGSRLLYVLIFATLFSIYPASMLLFEGDSGKVSRLRIAFVSDFHIGETTPAKFVERFVKEIGIINPG